MVNVQTDDKAKKFTLRQSLGPNNNKELCHCFQRK